METDLTRAQIEALVLLSQAPRHTSRHQAHGSVGGMTGRALVSMKLAQWRPLPVDTSSEAAIHRSLSERRKLEITAEGRRRLGAQQDPPPKPADPEPMEHYSDDFIAHAAKCTSQYDLTCRTMASEIQELRAASRCSQATMAELRRLVLSVWREAVSSCSAAIPAGLAELAPQIVQAVKGAPGRLRVQWTGEDRSITATVQELRDTEIVALDLEGTEVRFDPKELSTGRLKFVS